MNIFVWSALSFVLGYLLGSLPFGYWIGYAQGIDLTKKGSGSTGATNVARHLGKKWGIITLLLDFAKGVLGPVLVQLSFVINNIQGSSLQICVILAALGVIIGHSRSIWLRFKGGKSVACGVGTIFALDWRVGLCAAIVWAIVLFSTRYSSLASILAISLTPFLMYAWQGSNIIFIAYCVLGAIYIIAKHSSNIERLCRGEESKVQF